MRIWSVAPLAAAIVGASGGVAFGDSATRISGPHVHENLAVYFVHGQSAPGPVPLTLEEALANNAVQVIETGRVNELQIENVGSAPVFIQSGDIVKGGRQDRVLTVSLLLLPNSGRVPIASFCVEQGRWSARGGEEAAKFSSAREAMPSISALLAMAAPPPPEARAAGESSQAAPRRAYDLGEVADKQQKVWDEVAKTQRKLSSGLNASVASPRSASSLQLSLENDMLREARAGYLSALRPTGEKEEDIVGYVVAINGKMRAGNVYPSTALFHKMWEKQLAAAVTEAIGDKGVAAPAAPAPAPLAVGEFLAKAEKGEAYERALAAGMHQETRDADTLLYSEARGADGNWIHRSYLAK
jgi:hypothetical protein